MASAGKGARILQPKHPAYSAGGLNLPDGGATTKRIYEECVKEYDQRANVQWETLQAALGLHAGTPEQRRLLYDMRYGATIPFAILDPATGAPAAEPDMDPATGQVRADEKGTAMMRPVIEQRPVWQVLKDSFSEKYIEQAKDALKLGVRLPPSVAYDAQEALRSG